MLMSRNIIIPFLLILRENWKKRRPLFSEVEEEEREEEKLREEIVSCISSLLLLLFPRQLTNLFFNLLLFVPAEAYFQKRGARLLNGSLINSAPATINHIEVMRAILAFPLPLFLASTQRIERIKNSRVKYARPYQPPPHGVSISPL